MYAYLLQVLNELFCVIITMFDIIETKENFFKSPFSFIIILN